MVGSVKLKMENITKVRFGIGGICPLKMDRWTDLPAPKNEKEAQRQAPEKTYRNDDGVLSIPAVAIKAAMVNAAADAGRKMESRKNKQTIKSGVFISPLMLSMGKEDYDELCEDVVTRKGQGDKVTRVKTYRPLIKDWSVGGEMVLYGVTPDFVKQCLEIAGLRYGLLGHRPEFGRFMINKWEVKQ